MNCLLASVGSVRPHLLHQSIGRSSRSVQQRRRTRPIPANAFPPTFRNVKISCDAQDAIDMIISRLLQRPAYIGMCMHNRRNRPRL